MCLLRLKWLFCELLPLFVEKIRPSVRSGKKYFSLSCASGDGSTRAGCLPMLFYEIAEMNAREKRGKVP